MVTYVKDAWIMQDKRPRKRPVLPSARCSTNEPCKSQSRRPVAERCTYRIVPVSESICVTSWVTSNHGNKSVTHETDHEKDLEDGHVELGSTEPFHCKAVENGINQETDNDHDGNRYLVRPIFEKHIDGSDFVGNTKCCIYVRSSI